MSGGGGGTTVQQPQDNSIQLEIMRQQAADRAAQQAKQDAIDAENKFQANKSQAISAAQNTGRDYFASRGLSPDNYAGLISSIVNDAALKVPDLDQNPGQYFTTDAFASGIDNYQNVNRSNYTGQVNNTFTPGFDTRLIPDTAGDSIINSILGEQQGNAQKQIDYNRARGVLNDAGYSAVENALTGQAGAAKSTLSSLENSILGGYRQDLNNIKGNAGTAASGWTIGSATPDIAGYYKQAQDKANTDLSGLEGSIRSALGSTSLFDVPTLLQKGGTAQGPINLTTAGSNTALPFNPKKSNTQRGLGSTGVF